MNGDEQRTACTLWVPLGLGGPLGSERSWAWALFLPKDRLGWANSLLQGHPRLTRVSFLMVMKFPGSWVLGPPAGLGWRL
jgi:hypothetical protein